PSYFSNTVTVKEVSEGTISTTTNTEDAENPENEINYVTSENTLVYTVSGEKKSVKDITKDASITVFTSSYSAAPMIMPPQYKADVIIINDAEAVSSVNVDTYVAEGETLVSVSNSLVLNMAETTKVVDKEDKETEGILENSDLIVFYSMSTRSIPPQTTPEKVVVIGENANVVTPEATEAPAETTAPEATVAPTEAPVVETIKASTSFATENGTVMVPLREIAETLGFTVEWDGATRSVMLNSGKYSLKIDENSYVAGRMMPVELGSAPVIKNDLTFVPVEYFTQVLGVAEGTIVTE
ncbi:MAG: copper amine oxidase N-terminal domain-containing protein, partial [Clostridia bacterium]|nr:copper amine oxidase N-terminal domain-containing protein [Clostridia bacterium]